MYIYIYSAIDVSTIKRPEKPTTSLFQQQYHKIGIIQRQKKHGSTEEAITAVGLFFWLIETCFFFCNLRPIKFVDIYTHIHIYFITEGKKKINCATN